MGNPNHDPKTGEFSDGPSGGGSSGNLHDVAKQTGLKVARESTPAAKMLEVHLGRDTFQSALAQATAGKSPDQLKALAKEFSGARATSGKDALLKISNRNQRLVAFQRKAAATGGRSAG